MNTIFNSSFLFLITLFFLPQISKGQKLESFDISPKDNMISEGELRAYLFHSQIKRISKGDRNKDGKLDDSEVDSFVDEIKEIYGTPGPFSYDQVLDIYGPSKEFSMWGVLIRESHEEISSSSTITPISKVKAAMFSYTYDYPTKAVTWLAKGAILRPIFSKSEKAAFVPSITFNRVISDDSTKEANSFIPRLGYHRYFSYKRSIHIARAFVNYGTDFSFESAQAGIELEYEPILRKFPIGRYYAIIKNDSDVAVELRTKAYLHFEVGYVMEAGNKENLEQESEYARVGGKGAIDLRFFERLEVSASYHYLHGLSGTPSKSRQTTYGCSYSIGTDGNFSIAAEYQYGNVPITQEEVENFTIGFGIKF
ncbi:MAG TPA: hypothetical protein VGD65_06195 [Chryseosolibacter sp.]